MKTEQEIRKQLEEVYAHRLALRIERKTKKSCRNCKNGLYKEFDLGDFGTINKWECKYGGNCDNCELFKCASNAEMIEQEMILDISDPAICGAKEPKIAMLLWVLHDTKKSKKHKNISTI
jgi:hypothetical protein